MLTEKELVILTHLRKNARETLTRLSRKTGIPVSTIHDKLKAQYQGIIEKYTTLVNFTKLGFATRAYIILRVSKQERTPVMEFLLRQEFVNSLYKINNGYDFLVEGIFRNIRDLELFTERLDEKFSIKEVKVYHILDDIRREAFLNTPESLYLAYEDERLLPWPHYKTEEAAHIEEERDDEEEGKEDEKQGRKGGRRK